MSGLSVYNKIINNLYICTYYFSYHHLHNKWQSQLLWFLNLQHVAQVQTIKTIIPFGIVLNGVFQRHWPMLQACTISLHIWSNIQKVGCSSRWSIWKRSLLLNRYPKLVTTKTKLWLLQTVSKATVRTQSAGCHQTPTVSCFRAWSSKGIQFASLHNSLIIAATMGITLRDRRVHGYVVDIYVTSLFIAEGNYTITYQMDML